MSKKFELTAETKTLFGRTLYRIRALIAFGDVEVGELGGWIEKEENLSQEGDAWVYGDARVYGDAWVCGNARVCDDAWVYGNARVCDDAWVCGNAWVYGNARVCDDAWVYGDAWVCGNAWVCGDARICDDARVYGDAWVYGDARVYGDAEVTKPTHLFQIGAIGSRDGFTTFVRSKTKHILVACGCFHGTIAEFEARVKEAHAGTKHEKTYLAAIELAKLQIEDVEV